MTAATPGSSFTNILCSRCGHPGADLRLVGCQCCLHARCTPLSVILQPSVGPASIPTPVTSKALPCPSCHQGFLTGVQLFPMTFDDLDRAVELRKQCARAAAQAASGKKRGRDEEETDDSAFHQILAESSYLLLSHTRSTDHQNQRTGRWSQEEVNFVDQLVNGFDRGILAMPHGIKLNEFLGDMLLCKSSRLTKKMKNAKLSTRSYSIKNVGTEVNAAHDCNIMSSLQNQFFSSVPSEAIQLELRFNMTKLWRMHFSNLCLQVGYEMLDARDWLASLEEMEARASKAEDMIRKARRKRMGLALRKDGGEGATHGVFFGGSAARDVGMLPPKPKRPATGPSTVGSSAATGSGNDEIDFWADVLGVNAASIAPASGRLRVFSEDFGLESDQTDPLTLVPKLNDRSLLNLGDCGAFLERIVSYIESQNLPFQHVDVWVPSYLQDGEAPSSASDGKGASLRLFHAGHATRSDIDSSLAYQLHEYGVYSKNFSFAPGVGLPGRVYSSGKPSLEPKLHDADPAHFERAGGAKVYGVKTAFGIPMATANIGRIVLALYSADEVEAQVSGQIDRYVSEISRWTPEPKWKLVIELGGDSAASNGAGSAKDHVETSLRRETDKLSLSISKLPHSPNATISGATSTPSNPPELKMTHGKKMIPMDAVSMPPTKTSNPPPSSHDTTTVDDEQRIATLLGDHMPSGEGVGPSISSSLFPHFMSLRLILLRSPSRRSTQEQELLDVLKKSFEGYTKDNKRNGSELATLLAKDWMYLSSMLPSSPGTGTPAGGMNGRGTAVNFALTGPGYQSHVLQAPNSVQTIATTGGPLPKRPAPLLTQSAINGGIQPTPLGPSSQLRFISHGRAVAASSFAATGTNYQAEGRSDAGNEHHGMGGPAHGMGGERSRSVSAESVANIVPES